MRNIVNHIISNWIVTPKRLFLIDACGACLTAFLLYQFIAKHEDTFGLPPLTLNKLSLLVCAFAAYSFSCFFLIKNNWSFYIRIIAVANFLYCCIMAVMLVYFQKTIEPMGIAYVLIEIAIILLLVRIEWAMAARMAD